MAALTERKAATIARGAVAVSLAFHALGLVLVFLSREARVSNLYGPRGASLVIGVPLALAGALLAARRPRNPIGWCFLLVGVVSGVSLFFEGYASYSVYRHDAALPLTTFFGFMQNWLWVPMVGPVLVYPFLLFPEGHLPSPRWRWVAWMAIPAIAGMSVAAATAPGQLQLVPDGFTNPYGFDAKTSDVLFTIFGPPFVAIVFLGIAALWRRYRRSSGDEREQIKWLLYAGGVTASCLLATFLSQAAGVSFESFIWQGLAVLTQLSISGIAVAAGVAVLKYRLYDIDVVINRTLTYAALAAVITLLYVGIVAGIGAALGARGEPNLGLSIVATAVVAVGFRPLHERLTRVANRLVYGHRVSPEQVLSELATGLASGSVDEQLPKLARIVTEATAAEASTIWLAVGAELHAAAAWPPEGQMPPPVPVDEVPEADRTYAVRHGADLLGLIAVRVRRGETLAGTDERILNEIAAHAGLVLRNARLIAELRASRQRLVAAQDTERRRIERDLHDGAQQQLVALSVKVGLAKQLLDADRGHVEQLLDQVRAETAEALENLRALARGIYPPMLAEGGLSVALPAQAGRATVPVEVSCDGIGRYTPEIEATVYFCVLEALQNIAKYADAKLVTVHVGEQDGTLTFSVRDDGRGFDTRAAARGAGLTNMTDRLDAIGGSLEVRSRPGEGTTVMGRLPLVVAAATGRAR